MPDLDFKVTGVEAKERGLTPLLHFQIEVTNKLETEAIHSVILQAQIQVQATQRRYTAGEKEKLADLFGAPERWGQTLRSKLWMVANTTVRSFTGRTTTILPVPCTFDLNVESAKYFYALEEGDIPLIFLFSGTIFYATEDDRLQVQQISWNKESVFRVPVSRWRELMDEHYPNTGWLSLHRDLFDRLYAYRLAHNCANWDEVLEQLLAAQPAESAP